RGEDGGVGKWLLGQQGDSVLLKLAPRTVKCAACDAQVSALSLALSCQNFDEFLLPVTGYAGDADDLAGADREARTGDCGGPAIAQGMQVFVPGIVGG